MNNFSRILNLIGRDQDLFSEDLFTFSNQLQETISCSKFLVIGGAGTIGKALVIELFKRDPKVLHVIDISENNLVELVRELRSTIGYGSGNFDTFAVDCGSVEFDELVKYKGPYDYIFNLSALKHVRSESDPFTLMRMINVNIINTIKIARLAHEMGSKKYFCVSTDKAANPVNMMGASKRIMELFLLRESLILNISMSRFANVAFSDGSLLHGFSQRFEKRQPLSAPHDIKRYFITSQESGELCLLSGILGLNREIFFPKLDKLHLISFTEIAQSYIRSKGYEPYLCESEIEARTRTDELIAKKCWPCYFFNTDTTGEKNFEEFFTNNEVLDMERMSSVGIILNKPEFDELILDRFIKGLEQIQNQGNWNKIDLLKLFKIILPQFDHKEMGKYLNEKM